MSDYLDGSAIWLREHIHNERLEAWAMTRRPKLARAQLRGQKD